MIKRIRILMLILLSAVILSGTLMLMPMANRGTKSGIDLVFINAPQEEYYIALLVPIGSEKENSPLHLEGPVTEETVKDYLDNFWLGSYRYDYVTCRYKKGNGDRTFEFHYGTPKDFRVVVIRLDGTVTVSEAYKREKFTEKCIYDYATGIITEEIQPKAPKAEFKASDIPAYIICFLITLVIELTVLWVFRFPLFGVYQNTLAVVIVNLLTSVPFSVFLFHAKQNHLVDRIIIFECLIAAFESFIYSIVLINKNGKRDRSRAIAYGIIANILSALSMLLPWP